MFVVVEANRTAARCHKSISEVDTNGTAAGGLSE
jgi:hypothetical protein